MTDLVETYNVNLIQNAVERGHEFLHAILRQSPQFFPNKLLMQKIFLSWLLGHVGCDRGNDNITSLLVKSIRRDDHSGPHLDSREVRKRERNENDLAPFTRCHIWNR